MTIDISPRALSIARAVDRLQSGSFIIELVKPENKTDRWIVCIKQPVTIQTMNLNQVRHDDNSAPKS